MIEEWRALSKQFVSAANIGAKYNYAPIAVSRALYPGYVPAKKNQVPR